MKIYVGAKVKINCFPSAWHEHIGTVEKLSEKVYDDECLNLIDGVLIRLDKLPKAGLFGFPKEQLVIIK